MALHDLKPRQIRAATYLAAGLSGVEVAKRVKVKPATLSVWKGDHRFRTLLNELKAEAVADAREQLRCLSTEAVETLAELLKPAHTDAVRLATAKLILDRMPPDSDPAREASFSDPARLPKYTTRVRMSDGSTALCRWTPEMSQEWEEWKEHERMHPTIDVPSTVLRTTEPNETRTD